MNQTAKQPTVKDIVKAFFPIARDVCKAYSRNGGIIPAVAVMAQYIQESGLTLQPPKGVYFGVKAPIGSRSPVVVSGTWEDGPGGVEHIKAAFFAYSGFADAVKGYCEFITQNPRYHDAMILGKGIPERYLFYIRYTVNHSGLPGETGYATDKDYYGLCSHWVQLILAAIADLGFQIG